jgi:magnesium-transporting ATPase (P-type)
MKNREEEMMKVQEKIETNLEVIGATAIEDQLQDDVGNTIKMLNETGI